MLLLPSFETICFDSERKTKRPYGASRTWPYRVSIHYWVVDTESNRRPSYPQYNGVVIVVRLVGPFQVGGVGQWEPQRVVAPNALSLSSSRRGWRTWVGRFCVFRFKIQRQPSQYNVFGSLAMFFAFLLKTLFLILFGLWLWFCFVQDGNKLFGMSLSKMRFVVFLLLFLFVGLEKVEGQMIFFGLLVCMVSLPRDLFVTT